MKLIRSELTFDPWLKFTHQCKVKPVKQIIIIYQITKKCKIELAFSWLVQ